MRDPQLLVASFRQSIGFVSEAINHLNWVLFCREGKCVWVDSAGNKHSIRSKSRVKDLYLNSQSANNEYGVA